MKSFYIADANGITWACRLKVDEGRYIDGKMVLRADVLSNLPPKVKVYNVYSDGTEDQSDNTLERVLGFILTGDWKVVSKENIPFLVEQEERKNLLKKKNVLEGALKEVEKKLKALED